MDFKVYTFRIVEDVPECHEEIVWFEYNKAMVDPQPQMQEELPENFRAIACSANPTTFQPILAVGGDARRIHIVDAETGKYITHIGGHGGQIMDLKFSPSHPHILASCGFDNQIMLWDLSIPPQKQKNRSRITRSKDSKSLPPAELIAILSGAGGHTAPVLSLDWHHTLPLLVSTGADGAIKIWNVKDHLRKPYSERKVELSEEDRDRDAPLVHFPWWSTKNVHAHWIDFVSFMSNRNLSLVTKNSFRKEDDVAAVIPAKVVFWEPDALEDRERLGEEKTDRDFSCASANQDRFYTNYAEFSYNSSSTSVRQGIALHLPSDPSVFGEDLRDVSSPEYKGFNEFLLAVPRSLGAAEGDAIDIHTIDEAGFVLNAQVQTKFQVQDVKIQPQGARWMIAVSPSNFTAKKSSIAVWKRVSA